VREDYRVHWSIDTLPAAVAGTRPDPNGVPRTVYEIGFPLGFQGSDDIPDSTKGVMYINNHIAMKILYHENPSVYKGKRIIAFEVVPYRFGRKIF
jgi:transmembrane 9 superfamily protein 2/4